MSFGKKYEYSPVPERIYMALAAEAGAGKSSFAAKMLPQGKVGCVVDADQRFGDVIEPEMEFFPLSDRPADMLDPKRIFDICDKEFKAGESDIGLFIVDSVTQIMEPIILGIQRNIEEGRSKGARGYKAKADAMKFLRNAFAPWDADVIWVYHYHDRGTAVGKIERATTLSDIELARLQRNININCEIVIDDNGRRGVKVVGARRGRSGIIVWDDSGSWENIRQKLETAVWGGLTKQDQDTIEKEHKFTSVHDCIAWSMGQGVYRDEVHAKNSYDKLKQELMEEMGDALNAGIMFEAFRQKVLSKVAAADNS